jgi:porin
MAASAAAEEPKPTGLWERDTLTGDWGGHRTGLEDSGISLGATEISEALGNVTGGSKTGGIYEGRLELDLDLDLEKLAGWHGALIHVNAYQIHGRGLSANNLGNNLMVASNIEAQRATRLFDAWFQQSLLDGRLSVRLGQIAADDEFITSQYAATFVNSTFGWPAITAADLPSGGPAYPLATPGVRVKYTAGEALSWQTALFNGDPAGAPGPANPQLRNPSGTTFSTDQNAFVITELAYAVAGDKESGTLPATVKLGAWYHSAEFADQRFDNTGRSLADPSSDKEPRLHSGNYGLYGMVDRMLWRVPGTEDQGLAGFLRVSGSPGDRNLVELYADAGLTWKAPFEGRDNDVAGLAFAVAGIGRNARRLDSDTRAFTGTPIPVRDEEAVLELTYQFAAAPWWLIQPDLQYIFHPGGNVANPAIPSGTAPIRDAAVLGLRTSIKF